MTSRTSDRATSIFLALSRESPHDRARLVAERCGGDAALTREVEALLDGLNLPDTFLEPTDTHGLFDAGLLPRPTGTVIGDFVVVRQIGAGGTGIVYLAHQQHPPRVVALKVLRREFVASSVQRRFEIEAELLAHLQHPGIAQIYAAHPGNAATPPYIAMELVNGPPLTEYAASRPLPLPERVELVARACDAVQHAHQRGIIHRDLKPGNILVTEEGQPKVLDFGVARAIGVQVSKTTIETETGQLVGTLAYMSPEQIEATPEEIDTRTDIYALGVILFRLLAGRLPFNHDEPPLPELARRIVSDDPPRLGTLDSSLKGDLEIIVARALAKEKERRYSSAASLASDLRRYLAGQPISASADSAWYTVRRQLGRYRLALGLSAAAVVALAGVASYVGVQRARVDRVNVQVEHQLATSTIDRGRLLSVTGNLPVAEELVWRELFRQPDSRHAQWTLWDIYSREPSLWASVTHEGGTQTVRFSPDNRTMLTAGRLDGLLRILDVESGQVIRTFAPEPRSGTLRAFFAANGTQIVAGSADGSVRVWDVATGGLRREIPRAIPGLQDFTLTADGSQLATIAGGAVRVWSFDTSQVVADFAADLPRAFSVAADAHRPFVVAGSEDGVLIAFDVRTRTPLWQVRAHDGQISSIAIDAAHGRIATGGADGDVNIWSAATGERLRTMASENGRVRNLSFGPDGAMLAATGYWRTRTWDMTDPHRPHRDFGGAEGMTDLDIRSDGRFMATCQGGGGWVRLWDLAADARSDSWTAHQGSVTGLAVNRDGGEVMTAGTDGSVGYWPLPETKARITWQAGAPITAMAVSGSGQWLATVGSRGTASLWNVQDGRRLAALPEAGASRAVIFADSDRRLVVGESDGSLVIWDLADGVASNMRRSHTRDGEVLALASHGTRLFVAHRDRFVIVHDLTTGREIRELTPSSAPFSLAVSPDGALVAAGTWLGAVDIWQVETGRKQQTLIGQTALIGGLAFSPDGTYLAGSSRDGSTRLWDVASGQWLATIATRKSGAERVCFLADGWRLTIGYADGVVEIRQLGYFFRHAAGHAAYQLRLLQERGETFPRAADVLAWARQQRRK